MLIGHSLSMQLSRQRKSIVQDGLKVWLEGKDFVNSPPTSQLNDRSGNGNNATPGGMAYTSLSGSDGNGGIVFDGVDDYLTIPNSTDFDFKNGDFTITFSINLKAIKSIQGFLCKRSSYNSNNSFDIRYNSDGNIAFIYTTNGTTGISLTFPCALLINTAYNICLKRESNLLRLFVNGVFISNNSIGTDSIFTSSEKIVICALNLDASKVYPLNGTLKNMLIYKNRALTDTEILQNYNLLK